MSNSTPTSSREVILFSIRCLMSFSVIEVMRFSIICVMNFRIRYVIGLRRFVNLCATKIVFFCDEQGSAEQQRDEELMLMQKFVRCVNHVCMCRI